MKSVGMCLMLLAALASTTFSQTSGQAVTSSESNPLFRIKLNGKHGFIDRTGKIVIEPKYDWAWDFSSGRAMVNLGKAGYIDRTGAVVIPAKYTTASSFSEGLAAVQEGDRWTGPYGYIDTTGKYVIPPEFKGAEDFSEGLALVWDKDYEYRFISRDGKSAFEGFFSKGDGPFRESLAGFSANGNQQGFVTRGGVRLTFPFHYSERTRFSEGLAPVNGGTELEATWGYIDDNGASAIDTQFAEAWDLQESLAAVAVKGNDTAPCGFIDRTGKFAIPPRFAAALGFSEGLAPVKVGNKWGYVDRTGTLVISPQFDLASEFENGLASVIVGDKLGYIDRTGKYIYEPTK